MQKQEVESLRKISDFRLKTLLDRIAGELKQLNKESRSSFTPEYDLAKPVCEQEESQEVGKKLPPPQWTAV